MFYVRFIIFSLALLLSSMAVVRSFSADGIPSTDQNSIDQQRFQRWRTLSQRISDKVDRQRVSPHWIGEGDQAFWYRIDQGPDQHEFVLVDTNNGERRLAFDHQRLGELLGEQLDQSFEADSLPLRGLTFDTELANCTFRCRRQSFTFQLPAGPLKKGSPVGVASDDGGLVARATITRSRRSDQRTPIRFENQLNRALDYFWIEPDGGLRRYGKVDSGEVKEVSTFDGHAWLLKDQEDNSIACFVASSAHAVALIDSETPAPKGRAERRRRSQQTDRFRVEFEDNNVVLVDKESDQSMNLTDDGTSDNRYGGRVWWSPDESHFVVMQSKQGTGRTIPIVESSPEDSIHSKLLTVPYAKPGDEVDRPRPVLFSSQHDWQPRKIADELFCNPFQIRDLQWDKQSSAFSFLYNQRGHQVLRLISVDASTATPRIAIEETSETFICYSSKSYVHRIEGTNEAIWMSERSGWNHLYLLDTTTGEVKHPITSGDWVVREVVEVDDQQRQLLIAVSGYHPDEDPYHQHLARVNYDGTDFTLLTQGDGDHRWQLSPEGKFLIDTYSRVDLPTVVELRRADTGERVCRLETADASRLYETGWQPPERFVAKGRDGKTDIHGIIIRPLNFDPEQTYPVLEAIYAGPHGSFVPKRFGTHSSLYRMAELGFIVVKIDGMGTNHRSKAFHDVCWQNLADSGFPDRIAWMKAAAETRPEMDLSRVGIWGGSAGGQSAMRALIDHGDFYKAASADCGCHDNRVDKIWWNEQWMGWPIGPHYEEQSNVTGAKHLQGELLLIWGELDRNVDPASTMQVIDALIQADKDFDQLIIPGSGHGAAGHPYAQRRQAEFFVEALLE